jgi:hypothetical protein
LCSIKEIWPFKTIVKEILKYNSELLIHSGDFRYSKVDCRIKCDDNSQNWIYELFLPLIPAFSKIPILFIRGIIN